jgi:uncharacterized Rmd1/YagE family protein
MKKNMKFYYFMISVKNSVIIKYNCVCVFFNYTQSSSQIFFCRFQSQNMQNMTCTALKNEKFEREKTNFVFTDRKTVQRFFH